MKTVRTIYRCAYIYQGDGPVRESEAFQTEGEARAHGADLLARGYTVVVWRERQVKDGSRWQVDLDSPITQPLDA